MEKNLKGQSKVPCTNISEENSKAEAAKKLKTENKPLPLDFLKLGRRVQKFLQKEAGPEDDFIASDSGYKAQNDLDISTI